MLSLWQSYDIRMLVVKDMELQKRERERAGKWLIKLKKFPQLKAAMKNDMK